MLGCRHIIFALCLLLAVVLAPVAAEAQRTLPAQAGQEQQITPAPAAPRQVIIDDLPPSSVRIFSPPPMRWDHAMETGQPALHQGRTDLINLTNGVSFGMLADEVNALLPTPYPVMGWGIMPQAAEYPGDVRYFWVNFATSGALRMGSKGCSGAGSYLVFLFSAQGLFRLSYRLVPDATCPSVDETARDIFGRYVTIGSEVALTLRYRTGSAEVVDVTDPGATLMIPTHWYQVGR